MGRENNRERGGGGLLFFFFLKKGEGRALMGIGNGNVQKYGDWIIGSDGRMMDGVY